MARHNIAAKKSFIVTLITTLIMSMLSSLVTPIPKAFADETARTVSFPHQQFRIVGLGGDNINITGYSNNDPINVWPANGESNERWRLDSSDGMNYRIVNMTTKKLLSPKDWMLEGESVLYEDASRDEQLWQFVFADQAGEGDYVRYKIVNKTDPSKVLTLDEEAGRVAIETYQGLDAQKWRLVNDGTPAFPGAEGGGKYTTGGRGGDVYFVTNLNDSGPGSLREGVSRDNTTIIFRVGGTINLETPLRIRGNNLTIAGQTAPGDGITIAQHTVLIEADNVIIRYLRFRLGDHNETEADALESRFRQHLIIDHSSFSWAVDETLTLYANRNTTVQWSIISESLLMSTHQKGRHGYAAIWGGYNATFHHNLLAHHFSRNPRFPGTNPALPDGLHDRVDFANNVIYNWALFSAYGGDSPAKNNLVNNYYKPGPQTYSSSQNMIFSDIDPRSRWYINGNYMVGDPAVTADNLKGVRTYEESSIVSQPFNIAYPITTLESAEDAYESVLRNAGATFPKRDAVDARIVHEVRAGTGEYINSQNEVGGYPAFSEVVSDIVDTDGDGIPDDWELANGLDPNDPSDRNLLNEDGYTMLEVYLNSLMDFDYTLEHPEVQMNNISHHSIHETGDSLTIEANASAFDSERTIEKVEFYMDGERLGEAATAPFAYTIDSLPEGTHYLIARATDNEGLSTDSSKVVIHVNTTGDISPWKAADIGDVAIPGHTQIDGDMHKVKSSGNVDGTKDALHFAYQQLTGNGEVTAKVEYVTPTDNDAKAGVMIRENLTASSPTVFMAIPYVKEGRQGTVLTRSADGGLISRTSEDRMIPVPYWVRISRVGNQFTGLVSEDGVNWRKVDSVMLDMPETIYFGLAADSAEVDDAVYKLNTSLFSNVSLQPLAADFPTAPTGVAAVPGDDKEAVISWDAVDAAASYTVKRTDLPGGTYETVQTGIAGTSYTDTGLVSGKEYYYVVTAVNGSGESYTSDEVMVVPTGKLETIYYVQDDFEDMPLGEEPAGYIISPPQDDQHKVIVVEVPASSTGNSSAKAMQLYDTGTKNVAFERTFAPQSGTVVIELDFMQPRMAGTSKILQLKNDTGSTIPVSIELRRPPGYDQNTFVYNQSGAYVKLTDMPDDNRWYNIKVAANVVTSRLDIYINDELVGEQMPFSRDVANIARVGAVTPGTGSGSLYFDNLKVYVEPITSPKGLVGTAGNGKVQLTWNTTDGALSYKVKRSEQSGGPYTTIAEDLTETTYIDEGLTNGQTYYYVVTAVGEQGESDVSNEAAVTPVELPDVPLSPEMINGLARSTQAEIDWSEVEGAAFYTIYRASDANGPFEKVMDQYTELSYRDGGLTDGMTYYYAVTASNIGGEGEKSEVIAITPVQQLQAPFDVMAQAGDGQVTLTWTGTQGASFTVKRSESLDGPFEPIAVVETASYTDHVENAIPYYYVISASSGDSESINSRPVAVRAKRDDGTPNAPEGLEAVSGDGKIELSWQASDGAQSYVVKRRASAIEPFEEIANPITGTSYTDDGLAIGTRYEYTVTALNPAGESYRSNVAFGEAARVITVAQDGSGDFETVSAAIGAIPANNNARTIVYIKAGTYDEKIDIYRKHKISLIGEGPDVTILTYDDHARKLKEDGSEIGTSGSYSLKAEGNDFVAENLTIRNDTPKGIAQAVALSAKGDRQIYRNVRLIGYQDTLLADGHGNRQYYADSYIDGTVDFIFGSATAVFENNVIHSKDSGYVTAASTQAGNTGYVFIDSQLTAEPGLTGKVDLGRPWRPNANVTYINVSMEDHIKPNGWNNWGNAENEKTARFAEYLSSGPGGNPTARYTWTKQLTPDEAAQLTARRILAGNDGWDPTGSIVYLNQNAYLSGISLNGNPMDGFNKDQFVYEIKLPDDALPAPTVTAEAASGSAHVNIIAASSIPGTAIIEVTAQDGTMLTYMIEFTTESGAELIAAPAELNAAVEGNSAELSWTAVDGAESYTVYRASVSGGPYDPIATDIAGTAYTDSGLAANAAYYYAVTAVGAKGESGYSPEASVMLADTTAPSWNDGVLTISNVTVESVRLNWSEATDESGIAYYKIYQNGTEVLTVTGAVYSAVISGLQPNTEYTFKIEAADHAGIWTTDGPQASISTLAEENNEGTGNGKGKGKGKGKG